MCLSSEILLGWRTRVSSAISRSRPDRPSGPSDLTVVEGQISQAVSRNPVFSFRVKGGAKGDKVEVSWVDNRGDTNQTEAAVA